MELSNTHTNHEHTKKEATKVTLLHKGTVRLSRSSEFTVKPIKHRGTEGTGQMQQARREEGEWRTYLM